MKLINYFLFFVVIFTSAAYAEPKIVLTQKQEKEITVQEKGKLVTKRVETAEALPGEIIFFTINYFNAGDEPAKNVSIKNAFEMGTSYVAGSASTSPVKPLFSIDEGKIFLEAGRLSFEQKNEKNSKEIMAVKPEQYTHIQWVLPEIAPGEKGSVSFQSMIAK